MKKQPIMLFRVFTSLIFIFGGITHLAHHGKVFQKVTSSTIYAYLGSDLLFGVAIYATGVIMLGAGVMLMSGYQQRKAAGLLLGVLIPITLTVQLENLIDLGAFFKNVAISGSLLFFINYKQNESKKYHSDHSSPVG